MTSINLSHVQFTEVLLRIKSFDLGVTNQLISDEFSVGCMHNNETDKDNLNKFGIRFKLSLHDTENIFSLKLEAIAHFLTDSPYDKEFLLSDFVRVNAPAIAFPYIRSFISNVTMNSGYNPVFLPSYNFVEIKKQQDQQQLEEKKALNHPKKRLPKQLKKQ